MGFSMLTATGGLAGPHLGGVETVSQGGQHRVVVVIGYHGDGICSGVTGHAPDSSGKYRCPARHAFHNGIACRDIVVGSEEEPTLGVETMEFRGGEVAHQFRSEE